MNCKRRLSVDIMMLYISAMDHARNLKFSSYVHLPSINKIFQYRYLSCYVPLACIKPIYKYSLAWVI